MRPQAPPSYPRAAPSAGGTTAPNGLLIPPRFSLERLLASPRLALNKKLLMLPGAEPQNYTEQVDDVLALIAGRYRTPDGIEAHVIPARTPAYRSGSWAAAAARAPRWPASAASGSRPTTT